MDHPFPAASPKVNKDFDKMYGLLLFGSSKFTKEPKSAVKIKFTQLPDLGESKLTWNKSKELPRLRRVVTLNDTDVVNTSHSLRPNLELVKSYEREPVIVDTSAKRKIATITEEDVKPKQSSRIKKPIAPKTAQSVEVMAEKYVSNIYSRLSIPAKSTRDRKPNPIYSGKKEQTVSRSSQSKETPIAKREKPHLDNKWNINPGKKCPQRCKDAEVSRISKTAIRRTGKPTNDNKDISTIKKDIVGRLNNKLASQQVLNRTKSVRLNSVGSRVVSNISPITVIVPITNEKKTQSSAVETNVNHCQTSADEKLVSKGIKIVNYQDNAAITDPPPKTADKNETTTTVNCDADTQTFGRLELPNVTLRKDGGPDAEVHTGTEVHTSQSLPNLRIPEYKIKQKDGRNTSYIISTATLTYTASQKIDFHLVSNDEDNSHSSLSSSDGYPMNVVSVFKKEMESRHINESFDEKEQMNPNIFNEVQCLRGVKGPSYLLSSLSANVRHQQSDYLSEQLQRELNFINSFFESLQFLESCSLSEASFNESVGNWISQNTLERTNKLEFDPILSQIEKYSEDNRAVVSQSLGLLNLLIRDEQRRAKNLLFVLKMREDALKDFTKSQILWLENKKKQDNTDISTLKKKQRGALIKLQHECGEMQRMRKALLTLSEKRKTAFMRTKKHIELKLKDNVNVDQILSGKRRMNRYILGDRSKTPLKCFELSSSGCEESTSKAKSFLKQETDYKVESAEKCVQTGDSILVPSSEETNASADNIVTVDGGYLNILFHNTAIPQIFSSGKQYEVNENAIKHILYSSQTQTNISFSESVAVDKVTELQDKPELESSSSPSTARSLLDELDHYYKGLSDDKKIVVNPNWELSPPTSKGVADLAHGRSDSDGSYDIGLTSSSDSMEVKVERIELLPSVEEVATDTEMWNDRTMKEEVEPAKQVAAQAETRTDPAPVSLAAPSASLTTCNSDLLNSQSSIERGLPGLSQPVQCEAEELRRQQLAIEREIKALEQQQMVAVREIPDKPPPPYTPPAAPEPSAAHLPRPFVVDDTTLEVIAKNLHSPTLQEPQEALGEFLKDFCVESKETLCSIDVDAPWDVCHMFPTNVPKEGEQLTREVCNELRDALAPPPPSTAPTGISMRRSDHIDDILFAEWRRCEPEWTALHEDEVRVKNQVFESIFQKILNDTVDQYKKLVLAEN